jgi:predicted NACHT family NTPase
MVFDPVTLGLTAGINAIATNLMKVSVEEGWKKFLQFGGKSKDNFVLNFETPAKEYASKYYERHGLVKTLGMNEPIYLDKIYINVQVLNENLARCFASLDNQEKLFREQRSQSFHVRDDAKRLGLEVANNRQYLMVLGGPGIGKTTFLRKMGLEAIKGKQGSYQHDIIPVLLELKSFREGVIDLKQAISQEFANCGLSNYEKCTEKLLTDGKLLILLDALDEVPTNRVAEMVRKIQDFVSQYDKNRFIASCRIAAYRHNFQRFTDITIADFDENQIQNFIANWFLSHNLVEWGKVCWEKLNSNEHRSTKELAHTPLLLTLICIIYKKTGNFPANKATLYERALQVLLEEWDSSKEVSRESLYKGWDSKRKTLMLAEVAHKSFADNKLFFQVQEIANIIENVLKEMLPEEKYIDGQKVIRDVEIQHGILVARDEGIYSFSHLTIQEYLTACHIVNNDEIYLDSLVGKYLLDLNWREVFILIAGIKPPDHLLQFMGQRIDKYMITKKLQSLLVWVDKIANDNLEDIQPVGKRAIFFAFAFANINTNANANANDKIIANVYAQAYSDTITKSIDIANTYTNGDIDRFIKHNKNVHGDINILDIFNVFDRSNNIFIDDNLQEITQNDTRQRLQSAHINSEMLALSEAELKAIDDYLYAIKILIDCRKTAVRINISAWDKIESRLFMPKYLHE